LLSAGTSSGVGGYAYHTVPLALYCWLRHHNDFRWAVEEVIALGGDADSTGAVGGGIAGATLGAAAIPAAWRDGLLEWPRSVAWMRRLAERLARQFPAGGRPVRQGPVPLFWPGLIARNVLFLAAVLAHGLRRLLPPY
jgi:ADP-ribosyl-[dinitrogen reductase] hydrolase